MNHENAKQIGVQIKMVYRRPQTSQASLPSGFWLEKWKDLALFDFSRGGIVHLFDREVVDTNSSKHARA
jgi:hypothetical protein